MKHIFDVYPVHDIAIVRASGSRLWDDRGNQYLDFYGGHAVISIGHSHPHYVKRITEQLGQIGFYSNSVKMPLQEELADKLAAVSQKDDYRLFLCNSGAEANENALKLASFHTGRKRILAFKGGFHGRTSLAVAATDNPSISAPVNITGYVDFLPFNDCQALSDYFVAHGSEVAGVIVEAIQGVGGIRVASSEFLREIRSQCDAHGAVFIADEVQCGYGRTGRFFAADHAGVNADIYTMAKGMGNGFPVGGVLIAPPFRAAHGMLGTTFGGNHLACAASLAVLEVIESDSLIAHAGRTGAELLRELEEVDGLNDVRGAGLMIGFDVPQEKKDLRSKLLQEQRIFTGASGAATIRLLPALNLTAEDSLYLTNSLKSLLAAVAL